jgi:hypothetical protein
MGCSCQGRKGDQGVQGIQGDTGAIGPTGPAPSFTVTTLANEAFAGVPIVKSITVTAPSTGTLFLWGHVTLTEVDISIMPLVTVTPKVNGAAVGEISMASLLNNTPDQGYVSIPITASGSILIGEPIDIEITLDDYGGTASVVIGNVFWYIV